MGQSRSFNAQKKFMAVWMLYVQAHMQVLQAVYSNAMRCLHRIVFTTVTVSRQRHVRVILLG